tara:strand:- start:15 stop:428 length:414 start_codon:yes stop_codon:yes gene_type:complete
MPSKLDVDEIAAKNGTGPVTLTKQSAAKAWATVDAYQATTGTTSSFNISSTTDDGTGLWDNAFVNNMDSTPYAVSQMGTGGGDTEAYIRALHVRGTAHTETTPSSMLTSGVGLKYVFTLPGIYGYAFGSFQIFGDLA